MGRVRLTGTLHLASPEETFLFGRSVGQTLPSHTVLALYGDLGAGKTTFVQGLAAGLGIEEPITSPTFVILNVYEGKVPLYHFDLYRLKGTADFITQGFEEYLTKDGICVLEWPERIDSLLPPQTLSLHLEYTPTQGRTATWRAPCS